MHVYQLVYSRPSSFVILTTQNVKEGKGKEKERRKKRERKERTNDLESELSLDATANG